MSNIKKAMQPLHELLVSLPQNTTLASVLANDKVIKLMEAGKGGFNGENSFVEVDGKRVGRICAMTGAVFAHDNTDKTASYFYKNGSYMIGAEIIKANARKAWEADRAKREDALEEQMLEGEISPKEWKEQGTAIKGEEFTFALDDDTKQELIDTFGGYPTKEAFTDAFVNGDVLPFTDFADEVEALRNPNATTEDAEGEEA